MTTPPGEPQLRKSTLLEREALRILEREKVEVGSTVIAPKIPSGENCGGGNAVVSTNVHGLFMMPMQIYFYDIAIYGHTHSDRRVELTKKVTADALLIDRRANCRDVMIAFQEQYPDFVKSAEGNHIYYDLQSLLYSLIRLDIPQGGARQFRVIMEELTVFFASIELVIKEAPHGHFTLGNFSAVTDDTGMIDKSLEQFLNIATSQHLMFNKDDMITYSASEGYMLNPEKYGFQPEDSPVFPDNGSYLGIGVRKSVRYVEGPISGHHNAALVVEVKKTPFHDVQPAMMKAERIVPDLLTCQNGGIERLTAQFRGLEMETTYGRLQKFVVSAVSRDSANQKIIKIGEGDNAMDVSITQYFRDRYQIELQYPDIPLLECRRRGADLFFPMELCKVSDNQRVRSHQQTPRQIQEMIKKCAIPPANLRDQTTLVKNSLNLDDNEYLKAAQIRFISRPLNVNARILSPPLMQFGGGNVAQVRTDNFSWVGRHYLIPAKVHRWAAYACVMPTRDSLTSQEYHKFIERFLHEARNSGIEIPDPVEVQYPTADPEALKIQLRVAAQNGVEFALVAHPDTLDDMHSTLKLSERDFCIITQGLKSGTVRSVINKGQTLTVQNIVNKTNLKLGGLNYSLVLDDDISKQVLGSETLYIGFGLANPGFGEREKENGNGNGNGNGSGSGSGNGNGSDHIGDTTETSDLVVDKPPSSLGYAANIGSHPFEFMGDILFQESRCDVKLDNLAHIVERCVKSYIANRRTYPRRVVIYRNGCSEGQFSTVLRFEVPLIKKAIAAVGCNARVTFITSNKHQNIRFFNANLDPRARPPEQNVVPGTVVDDCVVHPKYREFYLNSHRAIQGTARTPRYVVLYDDNNLTMDQMQGITNSLCYGHQIVFSPVSLPAPIYIAMCYAERGLMLYKRLKNSTSSDYEALRFCELNDRLGYENNDLFKYRRINA